MSSDWFCYLITSLETHQTYIGSTNNPERRLRDHNNRKNNRRGARRTRNQTWIPIIIVSGFHHKNACLSFESGWKRLSKTRKCSKLNSINLLTNANLRYLKDPRWNRLIDLLYFTYHFTLLDTKFISNKNMKHPVNVASLTINILMEDWIQELPWPYFIKCQPININQLN